MSHNKYMNFSLRNRTFLFLLIINIVQFVAIIFLVLAMGKNSPAQKNQNLDSLLKAIDTNSNVVSNQPHLDTLYKNNALHYATTYLEYEAKINSIGEEKVIVANSENTHLVLNLLVGENSDMVVRYPEQAVQKLKVFIQKGDEKSEAKLSDLKEGDKVIIRASTGIMRAYPDNYNFIEITKLQ